MHWRYKKLNYDILIPPLNKNIFLLSEKEAADYFAWFIEKIPERIAYLSKVCAAELRLPEEKLDCSPESLIMLWRWFLRRAKTEPIIQSKSGTGEKGLLNRARKRERQLTLETEYILRDIGMYFSETFRKNNPNIYWTYYTKPRRDFFVNHPLLKGFVDRTFDKPFEASFEPIHMAHVQAVKIMKKTAKETDLLNIYNIWVQKF